jgi:hypothetical protein
MSNHEPHHLGPSLLVLIDHHEAKIYQDESPGSVPLKLVPYDPQGLGQHLHSKNDVTDGKTPATDKHFFDSIAKTLLGADRILLFGSGTGKSSAMDQLVAELKSNHEDIAKHIVGSIVVDAHHQTEGQLLAKAREFFELNGSETQTGSKS